MMGCTVAGMPAVGIHVYCGEGTGGRSEHRAMLAPAVGCQVCWLLLWWCAGVCAGVVMKSATLC